jgi:hypothetical protein
MNVLNTDLSLAILANQNVKKIKIMWKKCKNVITNGIHAITSKFKYTSADPQEMRFTLFIVLK